MFPEADFINPDSCFPLQPEGGHIYPEVNYFSLRNAVLGIGFGALAITGGAGSSCNLEATPTTLSIEESPQPALTAEAVATSTPEMLVKIQSEQSVIQETPATVILPPPAVFPAQTPFFDHEKAISEKRLPFPGGHYNYKGIEIKLWTVGSSRDNPQAKFKTYTLRLSFLRADGKISHGNFDAIIKSGQSEKPKSIYSMEILKRDFGDDVLILTELPEGMTNFRSLPGPAVDENCHGYVIRKLFPELFKYPLVITNEGFPGQKDGEILPEYWWIHPEEMMRLAPPNYQRGGLFYEIKADEMQIDDVVTYGIVGKGDYEYEHSGLVVGFDNQGGLMVESNLGEGPVIITKEEFLVRIFGQRTHVFRAYDIN